MKSKKSKAKEVDLDESYLDPANHKVRITTFIDGDVLQWLKAESAKERSKYQTFLNKTLRDIMTGSLDERIRAVVRKEIKKLA